MVKWVVFATQEWVWNPRIHIEVWKLLKVYLDIHKKSRMEFTCTVAVCHQRLTNKKPCPRNGLLLSCGLVGPQSLLNSTGCCLCSRFPFRAWQ